MGSTRMPCENQRISRGMEQAHRRIVSTIRLVAPFFDDFDLEPAGPNKKDVILNWRDRDYPDQIFGPHQLSDGTLRAMCLVTLLLQAEDELPELIIVDEPELGLHPYALNLVASLFKKASHHTQVLISTQSRSFLDTAFLQRAEISIHQTRQPGKDALQSAPSRTSPPCPGGRPPRRGRAARAERDHLRSPDLP